MTIKEKIVMVACGEGDQIMPNWFKDEKHKEERERHIEVCKNLVALYNKTGRYMSYSALLYIAVGKTAHKSTDFLQGYKNFDEKKALKILERLSIVGNATGNMRHMKNMEMVKAVTHYYENGMSLKQHKASCKLFPLKQIGGTYSDMLKLFE